MIDIVKTDQVLDIKLPILAQESYIKTKSDNYGWFVSEKFILPYIIDNKSIFKRIVFMSEIIVRNGNHAMIEEENFFLDDVILYIKKNKMSDFVYKAQSNVIFNVCPTNAVCVPWGTHIVDIDKTEDELLMSFKKKTRHKIRNAIKNGVCIEKTEDVNIIYEHIKATLERQRSIHYPSLKYLKELKENLNDRALFFIATLNEEVQGCATIVYDDEKGYALYAGSHPRPVYGSLNLMYYEIMKILQKKGVKEFDFVGTRINMPPDSKSAGISQFKESFNPRIKKGYAFRFTINPVKYFLFNLISKIYLKMRGYEYSDPIDRILKEEKNSFMKCEKSIK